MMGGCALQVADPRGASMSRTTCRAMAGMRLLRRVSRESGTAVLVVTHDHRLIGEVDRVVEMMDGRIANARARSARTPEHGPAGGA